MKDKITRSQFLKKGAAVTAGVSALALGSGILLPKNAKAATKDRATFPFPYSGGIDPETVRVTAHDVYWNDYFCAGGVFKAIQDELLVTEGASSPWADVPPEIVKWGAGGGAGWGTLCGTCNGGALILQLIGGTDANTLITELWGWYSTTQLPTAASDTLATTNAYTHNDYNMSLGNSISHSPLCHASVTTWCLATGNGVASNERKERCGRLAGDVAAKTVEIMNAYQAGTFTAQYSDPALNATCLACHGDGGTEDDVMSKMECAVCHGSDLYPHNTSVKVQEGNDFSVNTYPNPFNTSTSVEITLDKSEKITIEVYNLSGQHVKTLISNKTYSSGKHTFKWNGTNEYGEKAAPGMYMFNIKKGTSVKTVTMIKS